MNPDWLNPDWPVPPSVRACCTTRAGGVSAGGYASFNLGDHVGDDGSAVAHNRALYRQALGVPTVFLQQVHGVAVAVLEGSPGVPCVADVALATHSALACTVLVADCLPVLLSTADGAVVAAAHAGWRGLACGVLDAAMLYIQERSRQPVVAWLGPCIGPQAFEVGPEVRAAFVSANADAAQHFVPCGAGKHLADLAALARQRLQRLGVASLHGNDSAAAWCTVRNASKFFSYRRDGAVSGRMAATIWRDVGGGGDGRSHA